MADLVIETETTHPATIVRMKGWAGLSQQATLDREVTRLSAAAHALLVLDLSELSGLTSLAVSQFVMLHRAVRSRGGQIRIGGCSDEVRLVLERCKLDSVIPIFGSVDDAIAAQV